MTTLEVPLFTPPWPPSLVLRLNLMQVGLDDWPSHPYTCGNRSNGRHGREGGDLGVLIATDQGWVCPHCAYTQVWAHALPDELRPVAIIGHTGVDVLTTPREVLLDRIGALVAAYTRLRDDGALGADVMLHSLESRRSELLAAPSTLALWVVYERPSDFPDEAVARRFDLRSQQPTEELLRAPTLAALREQRPPDSTVLPRQPADDPVIVESWLVEIQGQR